MSVKHVTISDQYINFLPAHRYSKTSYTEESLNLYPLCFLYTFVVLIYVTILHRNDDHLHP